MRSPLWILFFHDRLASRICIDALDKSWITYYVRISNVKVTGAGWNSLTPCGGGPAVSQSHSNISIWAAASYQIAAEAKHTNLPATIFRFCYKPGSSDSCGDARRCARTLSFRASRSLLWTPLLTFASLAPRLREDVELIGQLSRTQWVWVSERSVFPSHFLLLLLKSNYRKYRN